jgi:predicted adenylyl cyclase CyaB
MDFKIDIDDKTHLYCKETSFRISDVKEKIPEINQVFMAIGLPTSNDISGIEDFLIKNDFEELARINKIRSTYKVDEDCTICLDNVDNLGLFLEAEIIITNDTINQNEAETIKDKAFGRFKNY